MSSALNAFELFGLTPQVDLSVEELDKIYFRLQQSVHPDRFANRSSSEKVAAAEKSAEINRAYECLKHPVERLWLILKALGVEAGREKNIHNNPDLVEKVFELQERRPEKTDPQAIRAFQSELKEIFNRDLKDFSLLLEKANFEEAVKHLQWLTYVYKMIHEND